VEKLNTVTLNLAAGHADQILTPEQLMTNIIFLTGAADAGFNVIFNVAYTNFYTIINGSGQTATLKNAAGTTVTVADGAVGMVQNDGVNIITLSGLSGTAVTTTGAQTLTNKHLTSPHLTTPLVEDGDTGVSITSANQTHAAPTITIPDCVDVADEFVLKDTVSALTKKTLDFSGVTPGTGTAGIFVTTGATWVDFATAGQAAMKLLCSSSAATGDYATLRMRARADAAGNASAGNFSASAGVNNHGDLRAVEGYAQPNAYTNNNAANVVCGLYGCIDRTAGGTSAGRDWTAWVDTHMAVKASGGSYLMRLSHNGTIANDGAITVYNGGRMPVLFNFEDAAGFLTDAGDAGSTKAGYLAVQTPAGTKYIQLVTA